ncbi:MAG: DUF2306 domain-containing protein [Pseudomonadota bacterium]
MRMTDTIHDDRRQAQRLFLPRNVRAALTALIALGALVMGIFAIAWSAPILAAWLNGTPSPRGLNNNYWMPGTMALHAFTGGAALLIGPFQFVNALRTARPRLHRWIGATYIALLLPSAVTSLFLLPRTYALGSGYATAIWGALWLAITCLAIVALVRGNYGAHGRWMVRSYALTCSAVTIRIFFRAYEIAGIPLEVMYPLAAVSAVGTNLLAAEWFLRAPTSPLNLRFNTVLEHKKSNRMSAGLCATTLGVSLLAGIVLAEIQRTRAMERDAHIDQQTVAGLVTLKNALIAYRATHGTYPQMTKFSCQHPELRHHYEALMKTLIDGGFLDEKLSQPAHHARNFGYCFAAFKEAGTAHPVVFAEMRVNSDTAVRRGASCQPYTRGRFCSAGQQRNFHCLCLPHEQGGRNAPMRAAARAAGAKAGWYE